MAEENSEEVRRFSSILEMNAQASFDVGEARDLEECDGGFGDAATCADYLACGIDDAGAVTCVGALHCRSDADVGCRDWTMEHPTLVPLPGRATEIAVGAAHACAVVDQAIYCWGRNHYGQLGDRSTADSFDAVQVQFQAP